MNYSAFLLFLRQHYYRETDQIVQSGDFLVLGDTITWWPVASPSVYRCHYWGEDLEKIDVRLGEKWGKAEIFPPLLANELETEHGTIRPGEYLVHPNHGVGIFEYIVTKPAMDGGERTYVSLQYAGNDRLLFPLERQAELMPYIGSRHPRLTRLYSKSWQNTKERVQKNLIQVARELLKIYAARQLTDRPAYETPTHWQEALARSVDFSLTPDQEKAMREIAGDLGNSSHPMDRLICGDVGYGKTEVALRAAAYVMPQGKQVAFIAPTTVLVEQHYALLRERFKDLPVEIEHISRLTAQREKDIISRLEAGKIDLIVGTHRLLGKDIKFKDLGLLILDEEQKFGVAQKELLKEMRPAVDVLSLSATPIPRTLSMSLSGLRGLSILHTAPQGRLPVQTEIADYSDLLVQNALEAELERHGQVYLVHNRVQSLGLVQKRVESLIKETGRQPVEFRPGMSSQELRKGEKSVVHAMAHGQMGETALAETMSRFLAGEIDILVASSIVEHGLDSPSANTLIVLHSEWFGLSDLYQLRGRVGRRRKQAYAYFLLGGIERTAYKETPVEPFHLTDTARKRLAALKEADTLGSGWSIAMRDLEIRGGGNILGHEQHGSMEAIGLLLYAQLLQEEIGRQAREQGIQLFQKIEK